MDVTVAYLESKTSVVGTDPGPYLGGGAMGTLVFGFKGVNYNNRR